MKNQRILFLSVIAVVATMVVAGCASNTTTTTSTTTTTPTTTTSSAAKVFGSEGLYNSESAKGLPTKAGCSAGTPANGCAGGKWLAAGVKGTNPSSGNLTLFNAKFRAANGHDPAQYAAESYDAVMYVALGALKAGSVKGKDIKDHMLEIANSPGTKCNVYAACAAAIIAGQKVDYQGMAHDFDFDANHEPKTGLYDVWQVQDNGNTTIIATGKTAGGGAAASSFDASGTADAMPHATVPVPMELKLGVLMPLTGALNSLGSDMQKGAQLAIADVNNATTVTGLSIKEFDEDDKTSDSSAITGTFDKLVGEGVTAIAGPCCSGVTAAILDKAVQNEIVVSSPSATSPKLTLERDNKGYFWRVSPSDAVQGKVLADVVKNEVTVKTVAIVYVNNAYGSGLNKVFSESFGATSVKTAQAYNEVNTGDFSSQVTAACGAKADAVVIFGYIDDGANILKEMQKQGCLGK